MLKLNDMILRNSYWNRLSAILPTFTLFCLPSTPNVKLIFLKYFLHIPRLLMNLLWQPTVYLQESVPCRGKESQPFHPVSLFAQWWSEGPEKVICSWSLSKWLTEIRTRASNPRHFFFALIPLINFQSTIWPHIPAEHRFSAWVPSSASWLRPDLPFAWARPSAERSHPSLPLRPTTLLHEASPGTPLLLSQPPSYSQAMHHGLAFNHILFCSLSVSWVFLMSVLQSEETRVEGI